MTLGFDTSFSMPHNSETVIAEFIGKKREAQPNSILPTDWKSSTARQIMKRVIQSLEFKVAVFELNKPVLRHGKLRFCPGNIAYAYLEIEGGDVEQPEEEKKEEKKPAGRKKKGVPEVKDNPKEFYNLYEMYQENGVSSSISLNRSLRQHFKGSNFKFGQTMTKGHLTQENLIDDDFLVLKIDRFERLLVFDR